MNKNTMTIQPTSIDLFAGAGGMTEGLHQAGFKTVLANEYDQMAGLTFKTNHPSVPLIIKNIMDLSVSEILQITDLKVGDLSLISGGPPCQGFSSAGSRSTNDPRNQLFREFVRLVDGLKPEVFVFENVRGILSMDGGRILAEILTEFTSIGYTCEYKILTASDYGVAQARKRFILIGTKSSTPIGFPLGTHGINNGLLPFCTVWDALSDLPVIFQNDGNEILQHSGIYHTQYQQDRKGSRYPGTLYNHRSTRHGNTVIQRYNTISEGGNMTQVPLALRSNHNMLQRLNSQTPSYTITGTYRNNLIHPRIPRGLTVREAARLQSFDDDYQFFGALGSGSTSKGLTQDQQVGNAVPPLLAYALGKHIKSKMNW